MKNTNQQLTTYNSHIFCLDQDFRIEGKGGFFTTQNLQLTTHNSKLTTHNSKLKTQNSQLTTHNLQLTTHNPQPTTHNSQLTTHNSQLTTHNSQLTTHNSQLTTHNSQLTTHNSQLKTYNSQLTTHNPQPTTHNTHNSQLTTMKKVGLIIFISFFVNQSYSQESHTSELKPLLESYYGIKDALVNSDARGAGLEAKGFLKVMNGVDSKKLNATEIGLYLPMNDELLLGAKHILESKDLKKQREQFSALSTNFYQLIKGLKLTSEPIYYNYCPMNGSYWLSKESIIVNPYYGKTMLTCGKVVDTVAP
ncbi:MAG: hypothetical protein JWN56_134 [Sphingobacteriales bacterium]|nr:hypothetical protein [Sphingobacteriales bacterium]